MSELDELIADTPCPFCGQKALRLEMRESFTARPVGTWSLAGQQPKVSAYKQMWPWLVCDVSVCAYMERAKPV